MYKMFTIDIESNNSRVSPFSKDTHTYIPLTHNTEYAIVLRNRHNTRCDVTLTVDGEEIGKYRINAHGEFRIERPSKVSRKFVFVKEDSKEASGAGIVEGEQNNGLIVAVFTPERVQERSAFTLKSQNISFRGGQWNSRGESRGFSTNSFCDNSIDCFGSTPTNYTNCSSSYNQMSSGATVLGDESSQKFNTVSSITDIDYEKVTTIKLRLVCDEKKEYTSLKRALNPIPQDPPRIGTF